MEKGHGRIETRKIAVSREVVPYLAWPGLAQVARIERRREIARKASTEIVYLITSLPPETASPQRLLRLEVAHVLARDAAGGCHEAHGLPVTAVEGEGHAHALAMSQPISRPSEHQRVLRASTAMRPSCRRSSAPAWRWSRSSTYMTR